MGNCDEFSLGGGHERLEAEILIGGEILMGGMRGNHPSHAPSAGLLVGLLGEMLELGDVVSQMGGIVMGNCDGGMYYLRGRSFRAFCGPSEPARRRRRSPWGGDVVPSSVSLGR